jgi:catechol 2,3-dioxygenase-like lactoylglutathione lyase family enzyme
MLLARKLLTMIELDHLNLMVADVVRSRAFYETLLASFDFPVNRDFGDLAVGFGAGPYAVLALVRSEGAVQPIHVAFRLPSRAEVDRFYDTALSLGAKDNGPPGLRPQYHASYYAAFVYDPDGHNLEAVCHRPDGGT